MGEVIHLRTELENVASLVPEELEKSIVQIEKMNKELIQKNIKEFKNDGGENHLFIKLINIEINLSVD